MSVLSLLEYRTYCYNRERHPDIPPENYMMLFENWEAYEEQYQKNQRYWKKYTKENKRYYYENN